ISAFALHDLRKQRWQQAATRLLDLTAPGKRLSDLAKDLRGLVVSRYFPDHLTVVGSRPKELWLERNHRQRARFKRRCEVGWRNFRPLGNADLVKAVTRTMVVRP